MIYITILLHSVYSVVHADFNTTVEYTYADDSVNQSLYVDQIAESNDRCESTFPENDISYSDFTNIYTSKTGAFISPEVYPQNTTFNWAICNASGKYMYIPTFRYELSKDERCEDEYLEICDGCYNTKNGSFVEGKRHRFCGRGSSPQIISSAGIITIQFKTSMERPIMSPSYFDIRYELLDYYPECGGLYTTDSGIVSSPGYPSDRPTHIYCMWEISVSIEKQIHFTVPDFTFGAYDDCLDNLLFIDGVSLKYPKMKLFNVTSRPPSNFRSHSSSVQFKYRSTSCNDSPLGFKIVWNTSAPGCNETINASSGIITSPNFPNKWEPELTCWWQISVNTGYVIHFTILSWEGGVFDFAECKTSHLMVADVSDEAENFVGRWCSVHQLPSEIRTSTNKAMVRLHSLSNPHDRIGFRLRYHSACTRDLKGFHGIIESINFPDLYPAKAKCSWTIVTDNRASVVLNFTHFSLNKGYWSRDFVEVNDNKDAAPSKTNKLGLKLYEVKLLPYILHIHGASVEITFQTNFNDDHFENGFRLEWKLEGCLHELSGKEGAISSPNYPQHYPNNMYCKWQIVTAVKTRVVIEIYQLDIEKSSKCHYDGLKVYSGMDDEHQLLAHICGNVNDPIILATNVNVMAVEFYSDDSIGSIGFSATFKEVSREDGRTCGGEFTGPSGYITSPNFPNQYKNFENCTWFITVNSNYKAVISVLEIDLEPAVDCEYDSLTIYDGTASTNSLLSRMCNSFLATPDTGSFTIASTGNTLTVQFETDRSITHKGFKAKYMQVCGALLRNMSGVIRNPDYMSVMNGAANCSWSMVANHSDERIVLIFSKFHWAVTDPFCSEHHVQIHDGYKHKNMTKPLLYFGCCKYVPPPVVSSANALTLDIMNAEELEFEAFYFIVGKECMHSAANGPSLNSLLTGETYFTDTVCYVAVQKSSGQNLYALFEPYESERHGRYCDSNFVQAYNESLLEPPSKLYCREEILIPSNMDAYWLVLLKNNEVTDNLTLFSDKEILNATLVDNETAAPAEIISTTYRFRPYRLMILAVTLLCTAFLQ